MVQVSTLKRPDPLAMNTKQMGMADFLINTLSVMIVHSVENSLSTALET